MTNPLPFDATPRHVQEVLEELYGAGSVEVLRGQGNETGSDPYAIRFVDTKANSIRPVALQAHSYPFGNTPFAPLEGGIKNDTAVKHNEAIEMVLAKAHSFPGSQIMRPRRIFATRLRIGKSARKLT